MKVIFQNDDMGLTYGFTEAIKDSCLKGVTTSVSIMAGGTAYKYAVKLIKTKLAGVGVGLHLNLTDGESCTPELSDKEGKYKYKFFSLYLSLVYSNKPLLKFIERDFEFQFQKVIEDGLQPDHVDSDKHVHMIPPIFEVVARLCKKYKVPYIRLTREPYHLIGDVKKDIQPFLTANIVKFLILNKLSKENEKIAWKYKLKTTDAVYGVLHTNYMDSICLKAAINDALRRGFNLIEVIGHPAYIGDKRDTVFISPLMERYAKLENRLLETEAFRNRSLLEFSKSKNVQIVSYKNLN